MGRGNEARSKIQSHDPESAGHLLSVILHPGREGPLLAADIHAAACVLNAALPRHREIDFSHPITLAGGGGMAELRGKGFRGSNDHPPDISINIDQLQVNSHGVSVFGDVAVAYSSYFKFLFKNGMIYALPLSEKELRTDISPDAPRGRLPRPDLPRWAEQNRTTQLLQVRIPPDLKAALEQSAKNLNQSKTEWVREALEHHLARVNKREP